MTTHKIDSKMMINPDLSPQQTPYYDEYIVHVDAVAAVLNAALTKNLISIENAIICADNIIKQSDNAAILKSLRDFCREHNFNASEALGKSINNILPQHMLEEAPKAHISDIGRGQRVVPLTIKTHEQG